MEKKITKITENTAKKIAAKYNLGDFEEYCFSDGWYYFEHGRVGDNTESRDEIISFNDNKNYPMPENIEEEYISPDDIKDKCAWGNKTFRQITMWFKRETGKSWRTDWIDFLKWFYA